MEIRKWLLNVQVLVEPRSDDGKFLFANDILIFFVLIFLLQKPPILEIDRIL